MQNVKLDTKQKVLKAAETLFTENGFEAVTLKDIAEASGLSQAVVSQHFGTKDEVFSQVVMRKMDPVMKESYTVAQSTRTSMEKLRAIMDIYGSYILYKDPVLRVFLMEIIAGGSKIPKKAHNYMLLRNKLFIQLLRDGIKKGEFRKVDLECAAWGFFGMLSSYIFTEDVIGGSRKNSYPKTYVDRVIAATLDLFFNGIIAREEDKKATKKGKKR